VTPTQKKKEREHGYGIALFYLNSELPYLLLIGLWLRC